MLRLILGIIVGVVVGFGLVFAGDAINHAIWPPPPGIDTNDPATIARAVAAMPVGALAGLVATWTIAAAAGAFAARLIARRALAGWIVTALLVAAVIANLLLISHPVWVAAGGVLLPMLAGWLASRTPPVDS